MSELKTLAGAVQTEIVYKLDEIIKKKGYKKGKVLEVLSILFMAMPDEMQMKLINDDTRDELIDSICNGFITSDFERKLDELLNLRGKRK